MRKILKRLFSKGALRSKTIALSAVIGVGTWLMNHTEVVHALVPGTWEESAGYAVALAVAVARAVTEKPLDEK